MAKTALITGAYQARSVIAGAQRCVNLYMEKNPPDSPFPMTAYPMPGLTLKGTVTPGLGTGWRGMYQATNNKLYGVCGNTVYLINSGWTTTTLGTIASTSGHVHMVDNGVSIILVDGTSSGYTINLTTNAFATIAQSAFVGANYIDIVDGYFILNYPGTREWYISLADQTNFDAIDYASKNGFPDNVVGIGVSRRYLYVFGQQTTEIWFASGATTFPFERQPGVFMQYGCMNADTIAQMDGEFYWLAKSEQGERIICKSAQFQAQKISTFAIDNEIAGYSTVSDAFGYTFQILGHFFYVITFPTANKTWVYDLSSDQWNEWLATDTNGNLVRHPSNCFAMGYGSRIVGDYASGNFYVLDTSNYTNNSSPISFIRGFYHMVDDNSNRVMYREFIANMEVGNGYNNQPVPVFLRWSDTRGKTWGNPVSASLGMEGEYYTSIQFQRLGMGRDRVFELSWSAPVKTALNGAWVQAQSANQ